MHIQPQKGKVKITVKNNVSIPDLKFQDKEESSAEIEQTKECQNEKAIVDSCLRGTFIPDLILIPGDEIPNSIVAPKE